MGDSLTWEASFAIARRLLELYPQVDLEAVSLEMLHGWTISLPEFEDDPDLANDEILLAIYREWFEELNPL